jgi:hypothetical protein
LDQDRFLPNPLQFTIDQSPSTICAAHESARKGPIEQTNDCHENLCGHGFNKAVRELPVHENCASEKQLDAGALNSEEDNQFLLLNQHDMFRL